MISLIIWDSGPNPQLVVGILCGGLGGSVFTWYINRPKPQIVTYNVTTISLGADPTTKNLVPNLKIQVGGENVPVMHTHTIEFNVPRESYVDSADVALCFFAFVGAATLVLIIKDFFRIFRLQRKLREQTSRLYELSEETSRMQKKIGELESRSGPPNM